ncbi:MAG: LytR family transcriptional regulator, partial [Cyanobacteria bacterium J083]
MLSATAGALLAVSLSTNPLQQAQLSEEEQKIFNQEETVSQDALKVPELTRPVNILILGTKVLTSDVNEPQAEDLGYHALVNSFDGLSDTMLLVRFDPHKQKLSVLSIPRDTRALVRGRYTKINEANYYGGPALAAESISELLGGVKIDRYVRVNVQGVEKLVDALGGVKVYVPKDMKYIDESQHLYINLKEGEQILDGNKAMQFLRFRYDAFGDISRVQRQQILMRALVEQALNPKTIVKIPEILKVVQSHLDTNLSLKELIALGGFAAKTEREDVQMLLLPGEFSGNGRQEVSYWLPHPRSIRRIVAQQFDYASEDYMLEEKDPSYVRIAIQDSTDDPEAVQRLVEFLRESGYRRIYISNKWSEHLDKTRIIAQKGDDASAYGVRIKLGVGEVLVESTGVLNSDITIQLGEDW